MTTSKHKAIEADLQALPVPQQLSIGGKLTAGVLALLTTAGVLAGSGYVINVYTAPKSAQAAEATTVVKQPSVELLSRADVELLSRDIAAKAADKAYDHAEERRQADMRLIGDKLEMITIAIDKQSQVIATIKARR